MEVKSDEEVDANQKGRRLLRSEVKKSVKELWGRRVAEMAMYLRLYSEFWKTMVSDQ